MRKMTKGKTAAILLGRKGSLGFPGKNVYKIMGRAAMEHPLLAANNSKYIDKVYVSTDDAYIMSIGKKYGAELISRPPELCTKQALFEDALVHGYFEIKKRLGEAPNYLVILMCNACQIDAAMIDEAIEKLEQDKNADSAVSVSIYNMWSPLRARKLNAEGYLDPFVPFETFGDPKTLNCDRDSQGNVYFADMNLSVSRARCLENIRGGLLPQKWMGKHILPVLNCAGCDIDYEWQIPLVEFWLKKHGFTAGRTPYDKKPRKII